MIGFTKLADAVKDGKQAIEDTVSGVEKLLTRMGLLTAATEEQAGATEEAAAAQGELDVAEDANPIGLIIIAIVALIAIIVLLATHWKQVWTDVKNWALDAWHFLDNDVIHPIMSGIAKLITWIKSNWMLLLGILTGPIGLAAAVILKYWKQIEEGFTAAWNFCRQIVADAWDLIKSIISAALSLIEDLISGSWSDVKAATSAAWNFIRSLIQSQVNGVRAILNWFGNLAACSAAGGMRRTTRWPALSRAC